jgi:drug/metabolite transporter (DMT)-like permease
MIDSYTAAITRRDNPRLGVALVIAGATLFSIQDVIIKFISGRYPVHEIVFVRSLLAVPLMVLIARLEGELGRLRTGQAGMQLLRAGLFFLTYTLYYLGLASLPLADLLTLFFAAPLFVAGLSAPLLGERVRGVEWLTICAGFMGVIIAMRPGGSVLNPAAILPVLSALSYSVVTILTRKLGSTDSGSSIAFYTTVFMVVGGGVMGLVTGRGQLAAAEPAVARGVAAQSASMQFLLRAWVQPTWVDFGLLFLCAVISSAGYYCIAEAYRTAPVTSVAPFEYVAIPLGAAWGYLVWRDVPQPSVVVGMVIILSSGLYLLRCQRAAAQT